MKRKRFVFHPDYLFSIMQVPDNWSPVDIYAIPPTGKVLRTERVASFDEAHEDLIRSNSLALEKDLKVWAMIETAKTRA